MHHDERPVAFFDSGVGGLPYLAAARRRMPAERYVYLADRAGFPYGTKTKEQVVALATGAVAALVARIDPKAVVVACNTATELAIDEIRAANPGLAIVGTVPAIKPAAALSSKRRIGVVATQAAASAAYLTNLAGAWAADCALVKIGDGALVDFVEHVYLAATPEQRREAVRPSVSAMLEQGVDVIVLGCTHFLHLAYEFREVAGDSAIIVDSSDGIASRLATILGYTENSTTPGSNRADKDCMYLTGQREPEPVYRGFASLFGLTMAGSIA